MMKNNLIITIERENGSGGRYIGEKLAKNLGIKCYNGELVDETAKEFGETTDYVTKNDEKRPTNLMYFGGQVLPAKLFYEQSKFIKEIADKQSCVIIGRCSDYVLKDYTNVINIFITAQLGSRIERYCRLNNVDIIKASKQITKEDKERSSYYKFYTNQNWGDAKNYNLCIDTSKVGIDGAVELIKNFILLFNKSNDNEEIR